MYVPQVPHQNWVWILWYNTGSFSKQMGEGISIKIKIQVILEVMLQAKVLRFSDLWVEVNFDIAIYWISKRERDPQKYGGLIH